jgi:hypothetical protein
MFAECSDMQNTPMCMQNMPNTNLHSWTEQDVERARAAPMKTRKNLFCDLCALCGKLFFSLLKQNEHGDSAMFVP